MKLRKPSKNNKNQNYRDQGAGDVRLQAKRIKKPDESILNQAVCSSTLRQQKTHAPRCTAHAFEKKFEKQTSSEVSKIPVVKPRTSTREHSANESSRFHKDDLTEADTPRLDVFFG